MSSEYCLLMAQSLRTGPPREFEEDTMNTENHSKTTDLGLLALRLTTGGLMAGHGAQKLFGSFGGHGLKGTTGFMESLGLKPSKQWATLAGASEFGSGLLTALGFGGPI